MKNLLLIFIFVVNNNATAQSIITWSAPVNIANNSFGNNHPRITTDGNGNPLVLWGNAGNKKAVFSRWNGSAFSNPVSLNPPSIPVFAASWAGPDIASKGDTVYVVYKGSPEDTSHIYLISSFDGGISFSVPSRVDFIADSVCRFPTVTVDDTGNPLVAFMKFDSGFGNARWVVTRSSDYGISFSNDVLASGWSGGAVCDCCPASIICKGNSVALLYRDNLNNIRDSYVALSNNGGSSFSSGWNADQNNWMLMMCPSTGPDGVIIGDSLYAVFMNGASGMSRVYWSVSSLNSAQITPTQSLTGIITGLSSQNYPRTDHSGNALAIVWKQQVSGMDQLVLRFTNDITNGLPVTCDTVALNNITNADVSLTNGNIYIVWQDDNSGTVKYRKGTFNPVMHVINNGATSVNHPVFPNPSSDFWIIPDFDQSIQTEINLLNTLGIAVNIVYGFEAGTLKIKNNELQPGIYFLQLKNASGNITVRLVKG